MKTHTIGRAAFLLVLRAPQGGLKDPPRVEPLGISEPTVGIGFACAPRCPSRLELLFWASP